MNAEAQQFAHTHTSPMTTSHQFGLVGFYSCALKGEDLQKRLSDKLTHGTTNPRLLEK